MKSIKLKEALKSVCADFVTNKLNTIERSIALNKESLVSESKSSAGDKHETGRAMLQLEMEKAGQQLHQVDQMKLVVEKIDATKQNSLGSLGAVIRTDTINYFIGISIGKVLVDTSEYFCVSANSPIGKQLLGKAINDSFTFQGNQLTIKEIL
ncbi:GreA/GreB family elongation factor [Flavicella marina]|uniref:GreA/GreB family elongation factor n=1 Tax=Flavicella marina TaxID=1475951 RepID=UPI0012652CC2|nr:GreA/GreB family elongation factor [Flavicella marina]